jgi:flavin-dependent dehydrogenase
MLGNDWDALIIGGGPGGSTAATLLAKAGKRVLVLEKEVFPRFHIGESLLPYNRRIFEELGVLEQLERAGFPRKFGAQFHLGNASKSLKLVFRHGCFTRESTALQVERSQFDTLLLEHARASGAEVRQGWTATRFSYEPQRIIVEARGPGGETGRFRATFLIDASGRANCTGNQEGLRLLHPNLKKVAIFGHFTGVRLDEGEPRGDSVIVRLEDKWFWIIPLAGKVSVGCVLDQAAFAASRRSPTELFEQVCASSTEMRNRMAHARLVTPLQVTSDFSYHNRRLVGHRLLRVGDAAGFVDPIFSAGVYLAMHSGRLAARAVLAALTANQDGADLFTTYERRIFRTMNYFRAMVEKFYTTPFMELFMEPRARFQIPDAIVAILAGELDGGWKLEVRRRIFFLLLKIQALVPLVPRISFQDTAAPEAARD